MESKLEHASKESKLEYASKLVFKCNREKIFDNVHNMHPK